MVKVFGKMEEYHDAFHENFSSDQMCSAMLESQFLQAFGDDE